MRSDSIKILYIEFGNRMRDFQVSFEPCSDVRNSELVSYDPASGRLPASACNIHCLCTDLLREVAPGHYRAINPSSSRPFNTEGNS